jgi:hypothetical protein
MKNPPFYRETSISLHHTVTKKDMIDDIQKTSGCRRIKMRTSFLLKQATAVD